MVKNLANVEMFFFVACTILVKLKTEDLVIIIKSGFITDYKEGVCKIRHF